MRPARALIVTVATALLSVPGQATAQEPVRDFSQLNTRLKPGDTVWVTDAQGREVKGRIATLSPDALEVNAGGFRRFSAGDVNAIQLRESDSLQNGALIGLGVGGGLVLAGCLAAAADDGAAGWCALAAAVYAGVGAGIGVGIDAIIPGRKTLAYRAPGAGGAPHARLSIAPLVAPRAKGVAIAFAF